jgi:NADH-quinone oxidoreductase subunit I
MVRVPGKEERVDSRPGLRKAWKAVKSILVGHGITFREFLKEPITIRYPEEPVPYPPGVRGIPSLKVNPETGELNCTACGLCARSCPVGIITVEPMVGPDGKRMQYPAVYRLEFHRCLVCNLCVEACPFDSLEMADMVELSQYHPQALVFERDQLAEIWKRSRAVRIAGGQKI